MNYNRLTDTMFECMAAGNCWNGMAVFGERCYYPTGVEVPSTIPVTTTASSYYTTAPSPYCNADICDRHSESIMELKIQMNDLLRTVEVLKEENKELQDDVSHLQGTDNTFLIGYLL